MRLTLRMEYLSGSEGEGEDGDVILLTVSLGSGCDLGGGKIGEGTGAFESEELAFKIAGFDDAIGDEDERIAGREGNGGFRVGHIEAESQRQVGFDGDFFELAIGGEMAGIGDGGCAAGGDAEDETGDESAVGRVDELIVETSEYL